MSIEHDPPGYSQPTLPPSEPPKRYSVPLLGAGLVAVAGMTLAAYIYLPHGEHEANAAARLPVQAKLEALGESFPSVTAERACTADATRIPIVLHSAISTAKGEAPADAPLLPGAATGTILATRVAVLRTVKITEPHASIGEPEAGHYEGELVVFDAASNVPLCQTRVSAWSSSTILQRGVSARMLHDDFAARVVSSLAEAAGRMNVALDL
jgi:hypothetical protein